MNSAELLGVGLEDWGFIGRLMAGVAQVIISAKLTGFLTLCTRHGATELETLGPVAAAVSIQRFLTPLGFNV